MLKGAWGDIWHFCNAAVSRVSTRDRLQVELRPLSPLVTTGKWSPSASFAKGNDRLLQIEHQDFETNAGDFLSDPRTLCFFVTHTCTHVQLCMHDVWMMYLPMTLDPWPWCVYIYDTWCIYIWMYPMYNVHISIVHIMYIYLLHDYLDAFMMQIFKYALHDPGCVHDANI